MASRRLMKELKTLKKSPVENCTISLKNDEDLHNWDCHVEGPADSPYSGGTFEVKIEFPSQYPFKPPVFTFKTKIYHPSVELASGKICADVLSEGWGPTLNVKHCLVTMVGMLKAPDADHPLEEAVATMLREKPQEFEKLAKKYTKDYAM